MEKVALLRRLGLILIVFHLIVVDEARAKKGGVTIYFDYRVPQEFSFKYSSFNTLFGKEVIRLLKGNVLKKHEISVKFATMSYENLLMVPIIAIIIDRSGLPSWVVKFDDFSSSKAIEQEAIKAAFVIYRVIKKLDDVDDYKIEKLAFRDYPGAFIFGENE